MPLVLGCSSANLEGSRDALNIALMREEVYADEEGMHTLEMCTTRLVTSSFPADFKEHSRDGAKCTIS